MVLREPSGGFAGFPQLSLRAPRPTIVAFGGTAKHSERETKILLTFDNVFSLYFGEVNALDKKNISKIAFCFLGPLGANVFPLATELDGL